jgi:enhancing lycopene biosynthesis protein 2
MAKVAVILAGSGHQDGAEIREAVLSMLYLDMHGAQVEFFAPDIEQSDVVDHYSGKPVEEKRNVLVEAARIARGQIAPLSELKPEAFDALVLPGGYGVAKNLSDLAFKGADATVLPEYKKAITGFYAAGKPIGAICIAPAVLAAALSGVAKPKLTIGEDAGTAGVITSFGATHQNSASDEAVVDDASRIASTSAYMRGDARIADIAKGIESVIVAVLNMVKSVKAAA